MMLLNITHLSPDFIDIWQIRYTTLYIIYISKQNVKYYTADISHVYVWQKKYCIMVRKSLYCTVQMMIS